MRKDNGVFSHGVFSSFGVGISTFRVAGFVLSSFCVAFFRLFVFSRGVISFFRLFARRLFVFSRGVITFFRLFARRLFVFSRGVISQRKDEMAQTSHNTAQLQKLARVLKFWR